MKRVLLIIMLLLLAASNAGARDLRIVRLEKHLSRYPGTPLRGHEAEIVYCADKYGIDYRLYVAISCAESGYGRFQPHRSSNLTGILNGKSRFNSVFSNIDYTSRLIGTGKWYKKYRATRKIEDLVYVYKAVPPFEHYLNTLRYVFRAVNNVDIAQEMAEEKSRIAEVRKESVNQWSQVRFDQYGAERKNNNAAAKKVPSEKELLALNTVRYDQLQNRAEFSLD